MQNLSFFAEFAGFSIALATVLVVLYFAMTILAWVDSTWEQPRTLTQVLASQWRFVRDLMRRIY